MLDIHIPSARQLDSELLVDQDGNGYRPTESSRLTVTPSLPSSSLVSVAFSSV
jgi:hypothetical protein